MNPTWHRQLPIFSLLLALALTSAGCKEKEVPFIIDEEEVERAALESDEGRELFRIDGIISPVPYVLPADGATYKDSALSHVRRVTVTLSERSIDYGSLGFLREGLVAVLDTFVVRTTRTKGANTTTTQNKRGFARYGFLLKLGNDAQPYVGWVLYGYNGFGTRSGEELSIKLGWPGNPNLTYDDGLYTDELKDSVLTQLAPSYVRLANMKPAGEGVNISAEVRNRFRLMLTHEGAGGQWVNSPMSPTTTTDLHVDTVTTPTAPSRLYNLITLHMIKDSTGLTGRTGVFLPYRIP